MINIINGPTLPDLRRSVLMLIFALIGYAELPLAAGGWRGESILLTYGTGGRISGKQPTVPFLSARSGLPSWLVLVGFAEPPLAADGMKEESTLWTSGTANWARVIAHYNPQSAIVGCGSCRKPRDTLDPGSGRKRLGPISSAAQSFFFVSIGSFRSIGTLRLCRPMLLKLPPPRTPWKSALNNNHKYHKSSMIWTKKLG